MRTIAIVGAGVAGCHLAAGLQQAGYAVTLVSDRTPDEILDGPAPGSAGIFGPARAAERSVGLNLWDESCPPIGGIRVAVAPPGADPLLTIQSDLDAPAQAVDLRLKSAAWLRLLAERGVAVRTEALTLEDLDGLARDHDLVIVTAGRRGFGELFPRDAAKSTHSAPQRNLFQAFVTGLAEPSGPTPGRITLVPGVGEVICVPFLARTQQACHSLLIEAIPGGLLDPLPAGADDASTLAAIQQTLQTLLPWDDQWRAPLALVDDRAILRGAITPCVRRVVGRLPSGAAVLGVGDAVMLQDPLAAQGANNAVRMAHHFIRAIRERGAAAFDADWMQATFEAYWEYGQAVTRFCDVLMAPPEPFHLEIFAAAAQQPQVAHDFVHGFVDPPSVLPWMAEAAAAAAYLEGQAVGQP
ncbi:MAG TPA: styrene monooxygenase/indole monooxygenase family protein [Herpetosiphonaceae bacterium]|nr:styrene monooxygenase/indole monooxygenase family protein [Herpetosiphonaceae bacterium]